MGQNQPRAAYSMLTALVAVAIATGVSSCSPVVIPTAEQTTSSPTSSSQTLVAAPSTQSEAPLPTPRNNTFQLIDYNPQRVGHFLIQNKPYGGDWDAFSFTSPETIYLPGVGEYSIDVEELFPGKDISWGVVTSIGDVENPRLAGVFHHRIAASGLTPEAFVTELFGYDPQSASVESVWEVFRDSRESDSSINLVGSNSTAVALNWRTGAVGINADPTDSFAFDVTTGESLWPAKTSAYWQEFGTAVLYEKGRGRETFFPDPCIKYVGFNLDTLSKTFTVESDDLDPGHCENGKAKGNGPYAAYSDSYGKNLEQFIIATGEASKLTDLAAENLDRLRYDPASNLFSWQESATTSDRDTNAIYVVDPLTGETVWTLPGRQASELGAYLKAFANGKAYLKTTDETPVVDVATGEIVEINAFRTPLGMVDGWIVWDDGFGEHINP